MNGKLRRRAVSLLLLAAAVIGATGVCTASAAPMNPLTLTPGPLLGTYGIERPLVTGASVQTEPAVYEHLVVYEDHSVDADIWLYNSRTNAKYPVAVNAGDWEFGPRIWGNRIVWYSDRSGTLDIWWYDIGARAAHRLTTSTGAEIGCDISGDRVVWQDNRNGNADIYMYDFKTKSTKRITTNSADQWNPRISGNRIIWQDRRNGNWDIYWYDIAKGQEYRLSSSPNDERLPAVWGSRAAWEIDNAGNLDIVVAFYFDANGFVGAPAGGAGQQQAPQLYKDTVIWWDPGVAPPRTVLYRFGGAGTHALTQSAGSGVPPAIWGDTVVWPDSRSGNPDIYAMRIFSPSLTLSAPSSVGYGGTTKVTGYLKNWDGTPLANRLVQVQYVPHANILSTLVWPVVDTDSATAGTQLAKTDWRGKFTASVPVQSARFYVRAHFAGDPDAYWQTSSQRTVLPKVSLSKPAGKSRVSNTKSYTFYGSLKPKHTPGTQRVWFKCYRKSGGKYRYKKTVAATLTGYATYTKYSAKFKLSTEGKWRIRAYYKQTSTNAASYSSYKYVTSY